MNILLTSVGRRSYIINYFKEALNGLGEVHVSNCHDNTPAFLLADKSVVTPLIYDDKYIPFLLNYCKKSRIKLLMSLFDADLPVLARHKSEFLDVGTVVIVSGAEIIDICNDKWKTYNYLASRGFNVPDVYLCAEEAGDAIEKRCLDFPLIIKPRWGMGSVSIYEADCIDEMEILYKKATAAALSTYLKHESEADPLRCVIIQKKVVGQEYGLDVINDLDGNYITTIVKKKLAMRSGETDIAQTENNLMLKDLGKSVSKTLKHIANLDVDVFVSDGTGYILDINARFGGGYPFSHAAGVNLPAAILNWVARKPFDPALYFTVKHGVISYKDIKIVNKER